IEISGIAYEVIAPDQPAEHLVGFKIYDEYFAVQRVVSMTAAQFTAQVIGTTLGLLADLPMSVLSIDEVSASLDALQLTFRSRALVHSAPMAATTRPAPRAAVPQESRLRLLPAEDSLSPYSATSATRIAHYRWVAGHHFFDLCAICCRSTLR